MNQPPAGRARDDIQWPRLRCCSTHLCNRPHPFVNGTRTSHAPHSQNTHHNSSLGQSDPPRVLLPKTSPILYGHLKPSSASPKRKNIDAKLQSNDMSSEHFGDNILNEPIVSLPNSEHKISSSAVNNLTGLYFILEILPN